MKAYSLWQPWASAIWLRWKRIETRDWSTKYRGALAIHAAKRWTGEERDFWQAMCRAEDFDPDGYEMPFGAVIATVCLVDCRPTEDLVDTISDQERRWGNYGPGRFGHVFEGLIRLPKPVPFTGRQGFFDVPDQLLAAPHAPLLVRQQATAPEGAAAAAQGHLL